MLVESLLSSRIRSNNMNIVYPDSQVSRVAEILGNG